MFPQHISVRACTQVDDHVDFPMDGIEMQALTLRQRFRLAVEEARTVAGVAFTGQVRT